MPYILVNNKIRLRYNPHEAAVERSVRGPSVHFTSSGQSICILHCSGTAYGNYAIGVVQLSIFDIESKASVIPNIVVTIPLRTMLLLRQMVVSNVRHHLNEVHEPRL